MAFEKKYTERDPTSSAYRRRAMIEIDQEMDILLTELRKSIKTSEAKTIRLATITGLRLLNSTIGYEQLAWLADKNRSRKT